MDLLKGVIFDLDNTLVDFKSMKEMAVKSAAVAMIDAGLPLSEQEIQRRIYGVYQIEGIEFQNVFDEMLHEIMGYVDYRILAAGIVAYRRTREAMLVPYPHTRSTLISLIRLGLKTAVVSDAPSLQAWLRLRYLQIDDLFDTVITFDDTGECKPSPKPFQKALEDISLPPGRVLMIGDWLERDIAGAKRLGMRTVHARYGTEVTPERGSPQADEVVDDIRDILPLVEKWMGR